MATATGTFAGRPNHQLRLEVYHTGTDTAGNFSQVRWDLYAERTSGVGTVSYDNVGGWTVNVDGQFINGGGWNYDTRTNPTKMLGTGVLNIGHSADGTRGLNFAASANSLSTLGYGETNVGGLGLPTIPRASSSTFTDAFVEFGTNITINTNRASAGFTHRLIYQFGSAQGVIADGVTDSHVWTVPLSLLDQIPNATIGNGGIVTETYSGGTLIGTTSRALYLTAPASIVPTFSFLAHSEAVAMVQSIVGAYVQGLSRLNFAIQAPAGVYGSTITAHQITFAGQTIAAAFGTLTQPVAQSGSLNAIATITDSRGRTASATVAINVLAYAAPAITQADVLRALASGVPNEDGTTIRLNLTAAASSLINGTQRNNLTYRVSTRLRGATVWTIKNTTVAAGMSVVAQVLSSTHSIETSWEVQIEAIDRFTTSVVIATVATGRVLLHLAQNSVGIGKFATRGSLDVQGQIFQNDGEAVQSEIPAGLIMPNARPTTPAGWLDCNGQLISRVTHARLFAAIGVTYGAGNGTTTFAVPNYRGRFLVGLNIGVDAEYDQLGETGGSKTHTLSVAETPRQKVGLTEFDGTGGWTNTVMVSDTAAGSNPNRHTAASGAGTNFSGLATNGAGAAHNNLPPYVSVNYAIKT